MAVNVIWEKNRTGKEGETKEKFLPCFESLDNVEQNVSDNKTFHLSNLVRKIKTR